jgi:hypothetical protein
MKEAEKKLYGVINHDELSYENILGSGGFGEVVFISKRNPTIDFSSLYE